MEIPCAALFGISNNKTTPVTFPYDLLRYHINSRDSDNLRQKVKAKSLNYKHFLG